MNKNFKKVKLHNFYEQNCNLSLVKSLNSETTDFWYNNKHQILSDTEAKFINSKIIESCPHCGSSQIVKNGKRKDGIQRYFCNDCKSYFTPMTKGIFTKLLTRNTEKYLSLVDDIFSELESIEPSEGSALKRAFDYILNRK